MRNGLRVTGHLFVLMALASSAPAQNSPDPTPTTPDLLGIYPGMALRDARAQLQRHSQTAHVTSHTDPDSGFMLNQGNIWETTDVYTTAAPNDPPRVWMIKRQQVFSQQTPMSMTALLTSLREKYGKETMTTTAGNDGLYLFWIFDPHGKLLATADQGLTGCRSNDFINYVRDGPPPTGQNPPVDTCFRSFFAVTAMLSHRDEMLSSYAVELVNLPYLYKAATNTLNAKNTESDKARREQLRKANENKPTF